jgi:hypothetical protein
VALQRLLHDPLPQKAEESVALERNMGIKYRHVMGEVLFPMVKCRPDILIHTILLSQYMANPDEVHYTALKCLVQYLALTPDDGIYYWRQHPQHDLPYAAMPTMYPDNHIIQEHH